MENIVLRLLRNQHFSRLWFMSTVSPLWVTSFVILTHKGEIGPASFLLSQWILEWILLVLLASVKHNLNSNPDILACVDMQRCHKWDRVWYQNNSSSFFLSKCVLSLALRIRPIVLEIWGFKSLLKFLRHLVYSFYLTYFTDLLI